jgi:membrane associated rhomboid family serine protease
VTPLLSPLELILSHSESSTALQTLYRGYSYFKSSFGADYGVIAYVDTATTWVGASDPSLTNPAHLPELLKNFARAAKSAGKSACILPTTEKTAAQARALGYYAVQIGKEPWYQIEGEHLNSPSNVKQLMSRGAVVEAFDPTKVTVGQRAELDDLTDRWLDSRKMASLGFLNRVEPWTLLKYKKFFRAIYHGRQIGFLVAIPVPAKNAWYFVDLIRSPESPVGTSEMLIAETAKLLYASGVKSFTLGMSPFATVSESEKKLNPLAHWIFERLFEKSDALYGYKSLHQFKQKLKPAFWEPNYFICLDRRMKLRVLHGVFKAVFPKGLVHALYFTLSKLSQKNTFEKIYLKVLSPKIVPKSPPKSWIEYFSNARFSTFLTGINLISFYASTDLSYRLRPAFSDRYAYSWNNFYSNHQFPAGFLNLIIASFVHWDPIHLFFNVSFTLIFMTFLECILGSSFMLLAYFSGILLSNPLTSLIQYPLISIFKPSYLLSFLIEKDVGCSLGIFACMGVLFYFLRGTKIMIAGFSVSIIAYAFYSHTALSLSHITAMMIGLGLAKLYERY